MRTAAADAGTAARALDPWNGAERAAAGASHARAHSWACAREGSGAAAALLPLPTRWCLMGGRAGTRSSGLERGPEERNSTWHSNRSNVHVAS